MSARPDELTAADEARHTGVAVEAWWWWGAVPDASVGWFVGLELRGHRFDYWAGLVRVGHPYLYVEELDGSGLRTGLELKPPEMWAGHHCDVAFQQWSLGNEAHGVLLDPPSDALTRPYGERVPVTFDVEWYASSPPVVVDTGVSGARGYSQVGECDAEIELLEGMLSVAGPAQRLHVWGVPLRPPLGHRPPANGLVAPYRRSDGTGVEQVLTLDGWAAHTVATP